jgi:hypothetical protein
VDVSGCRQFHGEDIYYGERTRAQVETQKQWLKEQIREKKDQEIRDKQEEE